ncbi:MAG: efflux transporter outer membrane subunit [Alphaproteobacteria bacterium]|nr:efflux transporter outer membrane subunit [Alphaproteobacteria bacterium]
MHRVGQGDLYSSLRSGGTAALAGAALILSACTVGPDYKRPDAPVPAAYREAGWKLGEPLDGINRGAWWSVYKDPVLNDLEKQIDISNQNLKAAAAAYRQAEWIVAESRSGFFPTATVDASAQRSRGGGAAGSGTTPVAGGGAGGRITNFFSTSTTASWAPDLWGRVRRLVEGDVASAQASAGDLASARLSAQGTLASNYLQLRVADELRRLLDTSAAAFAESLRITRNQYRSGTADQSAVSQAEAQLKSTQAQAIAVGLTRAQLEHAIAVLIGKPPAEFSIPPTKFVIAVPKIPPGVPSALLERRPDIAAAERQMASSNAQIGVAEAAFYPTITLSGDYGVSALEIAKLFTDQARFWAFGSSLAQTVFDAGARAALTEEARAIFDQTIATYRQTVLTAFQQVEDQLAALRILARQAQVQDAAVAAAREAERVINNQYLAGTVAYTSVIVAEQTALADAETAVNIRQSRLVASAALIQALGGGWNTSQLPSRKQIEEHAPLNFSPFPPPESVRMSR